MSELKAVVLCAGEGTRLRPLTFSKPKHLLPIAGRLLLGRVLDAIAETGIREVGLVVGHRSDTVREYVGDGSQWGMRASYITQERPLGLAHAVNLTRNFVGDTPFLVYLGDNLLEAGITPFVQEFIASDNDAAIMLTEVEDPRRYGVAVLDGNNRIVRLLEKPSDPPTNLAVVGVYAFNAGIFDAIGAIRPSARGELELTDAIQQLVDSGKQVQASILSGFWEDAGEPLTLLRANRRYLDLMTPQVEAQDLQECVISPEARIHPGTRMVNCTLTGPCLIGRNCVLENATLGPYVVLGDNVTVKNSVLANCVVQDGCRILNIAGGLTNSVLGQDVEIHGNSGNTCPLHLILGDMAQIRMV